MVSIQISLGEQFTGSAAPSPVVVTVPDDDVATKVVATTVMTGGGCIPRRAAAGYDASIGTTSPGSVLRVEG